MGESKFPEIKKSLGDFLYDEEGNISRNKIITVGSLILILSMVYGMDAFASHSSHSSHESHSSHSSHSSGQGYYDGSDSNSGYSTSTGGTSTSTVENSGTAVDLSDLTSWSSIFNADFYATKYPDLKAAYGNNVNALFEHFKEHGMSEGRQGSAEFKVDIYKANYPDLANTFGNDLKSYYLHYMNYGKTEGRIAD